MIANGYIRCFSYLVTARVNTAAGYFMKIRGRSQLVHNPSARSHDASVAAQMLEYALYHKVVKSDGPIPAPDASVLFLALKTFPSCLF
jgi:hypothetical protein